jgi:S-disulfanyl-L-cysteine oxidoreductase SoxD
MKGSATFLAVAGVMAIGLSFSALRAEQEKTSWDAVYTEAQAARGEKLWGEKCAKCHGPDLSGGDAPSLVGSEFSGNWDDLSLGDLAERLRVSMPQDNPQSLSREQTAELVATILRGNHMPAGQTELPFQTEYLKMIKYKASKP